MVEHILGALAKGVRQTLRVWEANKVDTQLKSDNLRKQKEFCKAVRSCKRRYRRDRSNRLLQEQKKDPTGSFGTSLRAWVKKTRGASQIQSQMPKGSVSVNKKQ